MNINDEYICDYLVTAAHKKNNQIFLELLQEFDRLCKAAGLTYWLAYGGLIGAVRHKGFIPWDDDIDLMMPRKDFDRLQKMTQEDFGVREPYFLQNLKNEPQCLQALIRFRRSDTTDIRHYDLFYAQTHPRSKWYNMGMNLAIFPVDNLPANKLGLALQRKFSYLLRRICYRATAPDRPVAQKICSAVTTIFGPRNIMNLLHSLYRCCRINRSGTIHVLDGLYPSPQRFPKEAIDETILLPFEDILVPAPGGYDVFLTSIYGDYMQFPPAESRSPSHGDHITAEESYLEYLEKTWGL